MQIDIPYLGKNIDVDGYVAACTYTHAKHTPFWENYSEKHNFNLERIDTLDRLIDELPVYPSSILKKINPMDIVPSASRNGNLIESVSSGTTGEPKTVYWHAEEVELMTDFANYVLTTQNFPKGEKWIGTETRNKVLKKYLRGLAKRFDGSFEGVEVNEEIVNAVKKAAGSGKIGEMMKAYSPIIEKVVSSVQQGTCVYEDATLGLLLVGQALQSLEIDHKIKGVLFGGVATSAQNVNQLKNIFPQSQISGWYGNHFSGTVMYRQISDSNKLCYQSAFPLVIITVRRGPYLTEVVNYDERGIVVATKISKHSLLSLELGDEATRTRSIQPLNWDGIVDVSRVPEEEMKRTEKELFSKFLP